MLFIKSHPEDQVVELSGSIGMKRLSTLMSRLSTVSSPFSKLYTGEQVWRQHTRHRGIEYSVSLDLNAFNLVTHQEASSQEDVSLEE